MTALIAQPPQSKDEMEVVCPHCKAVQPPSVWLAAHWFERLTGTCQACGKKFNFKAGRTWK